MAPQAGIFQALSSPGLSAIAFSLSAKFIESANESTNTMDQRVTTDTCTWRAEEFRANCSLKIFFPSVASGIGFAQ